MMTYNQVIGSVIRHILDRGWYARECSMLKQVANSQMYKHRFMCLALGQYEENIDKRFKASNAIDLIERNLGEYTTLYAYLKDSGLPNLNSKLGVNTPRTHKVLVSFWRMLSSELLREESFDYAWIAAEGAARAEYASLYV